MLGAMVKGVAVGKPYLAARSGTLSPPTRALVIPKKRPFKWMIMTFHPPEEYHSTDVEDYTPWYLVMRYLLVDLPEQLENLENIGSLKAW